MNSVLKLDRIDQVADKLIADSQVSRRFADTLYDYLLEAYGLAQSSTDPDVELFVNAQSNTYQREVNNICGSVQLSPVRTSSGEFKRTIARKPDCKWIDPTSVKLLYDSGAFTDVLTNDRQTPEIALKRQLTTLRELPFVPPETYLVSYDRLIDEKWIDGRREKQRWSVEEGRQAVKDTVDAAFYLDSQRGFLERFKLVMSCQGVDAQQYRECVDQVLEYTQPQDCLGLGGWCILGKQRRWLPVFWETIKAVIPAIAEANIRHVHVFGCTWYKPIQGCRPPIPSLLWLCDQYGIRLSTDSRSAIGNALWKDWRKAGATFPYWRHNLAWVKTELATLRESAYYSPPP